MSLSEAQRGEPIALIGSGCRFPGGASSPSRLWELLKSPRDLVKKVPKERFNIDGYYHPDGHHHGRTNAQYAYFLEEDPYTFDPGFFNISPNEADTIDPQQRLLLETVFDSLLSAGLRMEDLRGSPTAVYVGLMQRDFLDNSNYDIDALSTYAATGAAASILSNRVSYAFGWHGPSMTIDTACSSSLVAVHLAVQQLRTGASRVAVAAGSNLILGPTPFVTASKLNMFSPTGRSRMWDAAADGYARGEGIAAVVLKTLTQAIADGDTIECIIRETGINQDGKTPGITMPSPAAQEALIRQVYKTAGLDITKPEDRCQYFEAHGTGTQAGDPQEACAISSAFFGDRQRAVDEDPLYVGSIKTIIGHTEGTAGVAGLIKASQVIQHGILPPNMLFNELNPRVAPFYSDLRVVTEQQAWPALKFNQPRRVSVNSFGFGGTNAHVILESYVPASKLALDPAPTPCLAPIVLSAHSTASLRASLEDLKQCLTSQPELRLCDLAWTLLNKRSALQVRHTIQAKTVPALCEALDRDAPLVSGKQAATTISDVKRKPQVLGIFTGQGAQWPAMGKILISEVAYARNIVSELDYSLQSLPAEYRPRWSLMHQLLLEGEHSNVHDAAFSQPLCCAVQIVLIKLLEAAGVTFKVVIGHSSGEIACAFAAGFISASQAIRIAYLRGFTAEYARGPDGIEGAMLAAGTSFDDASDLCALEAFENRLTVAASNGPDSVTLSGDKDAILEAYDILIDESRFARVLKVDKAYHSHHMRPCAEPYVTALKACGCDTFTSRNAPRSTWLSSVHEGKIMWLEDLSAEYWKENLLSPVLFSPAVELAVLKHTPLDICIEVGAHPALKNPTLQTIQNCIGSDLPYVGCMERKKDDTEAFASCLGYMWLHFGSAAIDIDTLYSSLSINAQVRDLSKELPSYSWDHSRSYRKESRALRALLDAERPHLLLGRRSAHSTPLSTHWQNFICPRDIEWLDGHSLQGQIVFPGAGYVVMAMEAAVKLSGERSIQLLEALDVKIDKAVTFEDENSMVELNLSIDVDPSQTMDAYAVYSFTINSCLARETGPTRSVAGTLAITYGSATREALPAPSDEPAHLNDVSIDRFYNMLDEAGYNYTKQFRGITSLRRGDGKAYGTINFHRLEDGHRNMVIHPSTLDVAFQSMIGAYAAPGDGRLRSLLVPTRIGRIALNPWIADWINASSSQVDFISTNLSSVGTNMQGDIEVFDSETKATMLHIEGIGFKPTFPPSAADDHDMYTKWSWGPLNPDPLLNEVDRHATEQDKKDVAVIERVTYWYIRFILDRVTAEDREKAPFHFAKYIQWCEHVLSETQGGRNVWYTPDWDKDTRADIEEMIRKNICQPFIRLIQRVGEGALQTFRNNENAFDLLDHDGLLTEFYSGEVSYGQSYYYYQRMLEQITHRYPNMDVLEVGAGTAGATRLFLNHDQLSFNSYTFTDISRTFFEPAAKEFERHAAKMDFQPLDIRLPPSEQGFKPNSYDLIAASNVLHATPNLEVTMANVRSLLKPGGRLIVIEIAHREHTRVGFIFGLFPDWWSGHEEGRVLEPFISYDEWDKLLKRTGFSGIDSRSFDPDSTTFPSGVFLSHAVDDFIRKLDSPLTAPLEDSYRPLVIVGGSSPKTAELVVRLPDILPVRKIDTVPSFREIIDFDLHPGSTFIVLSELDEHTFAALDNEKFDALQTIFNAARHVLWVTENAWNENPQQAQSIGLLRTLRHEYPDIQIQLLDVDNVRTLEPRSLIETVLRLEHGAKWEDGDLLWTQEPELYLSGGKVLISRLKRDVERNNRLNSGRRPILVDLDPRKENLSLEYDEGKPFFGANVERFIPLFPDETSVKVHVQYSLAKALRIGRLGFYYLIQGNVAGSEDTIVMALSDRNASHVQVPSRQCIHVGRRQEWAKSPLLDISANIVALTLMSDLVQGSAVLVFEPPSFYVESLRDQAAAAGISLTFASTKAAPKVSGIQWISLHDRETERSLRQKLPTKTSVLYDLVADQNPASLSCRLVRCLPPGCSVRGPDHLFQNVATPMSELGSQAATQILAEAVKTVRKSSDIDSMPVLTGHEILSSKSALEVNAMIDWATDKLITSRIRPIETNDLFVGDKTYLLVGLAGDMGRSIARFMVERGARHLVLSSRVPKIDQRWIDDIARSGGRVMVLPMDVSNEASVDKGLAEVRASMPPIVGVAFGPLLLQDVMFKNMELWMMEMVLAPKVTGVRLLNERFSDPANPLDFFVMFSSIVMVVGNPGQAAYSAANAYLHAITKQRRARGMAASTIDIGAVIGVGFISRAGRESESQTRKFLADEVKEWELHALFAEAVVAGRNQEIDDVELVTGMVHMDEKERDRIPWYNDPRFAAFKLSDRHTAGNAATGAVESLKDQLTKAETLDQVRTIILEGVSIRIRGALLLAATDELNLTAPLIDQGVDSLSAVTVASWFAKNLNLDVPLLKILGGASVSDLVDDAVSRLSVDLIPLVDSGSREDGVQMAESVPPIAPSETVGTSSSDGSTFSAEHNGDIPTPLSQTSQADDGFQHVGPLSIMQEYTWKQMQLPLDPTTFNSTIGIYMQGPLDLSRLNSAFDQALRRSDAFRTCFISDPDSSFERPMQAIMRLPRNSFQSYRVADRNAADQAFKDLQKVRYDLEKGETLKIIDYFWTPTDHLLVIAYHRLVGDGWTTEHLFVDVSQLYSGLPLEPAPSYVDYAIRQRSQLTSGAFDADLTYWSDLFRTLPPRLPVLSLASTNLSNSTPLDWTSHEATARLNRMEAVRIKDRSRKRQATPMHFYLTSFYILLARLTASTDIAIGVADAGRASLIDQATMGFFASYLPVRLPYDPGHTFNEALGAIKEQMRAALLHSAVPLPSILDRLGLPISPSADDPSSHAPLFQAIFDYKQGQTESGSIGEAKMVETNIPRAGTPYDITLQIGDDPSKGEPVITVKLRKERYGLGAAEAVIQAYLSILNTFSRNPVLRVTDGTLDHGAIARS
ncbi:uncharacterized protein Z519_04309 [Cladophialophora bantiana CBS 173.52]|uniref:Carrier domain-containing protein n=1 Tax=Cladophialophora bantiana (strain ATCC 10958 / CBS 173.52 / CDC B-1940 / NIH 8579) TaxID=1442370 RepID=A0A0D2IG38_CLAB1|nr:uncharacterized protein Z519_04309 [Cladophialophora bantiana CBS 173.52]KIW95724.1 hypothetical protein Z519_04309 [Cladophialophora bantiana CBS 173.52]